MSQPPEVFQVGEHVFYVGFRRRIYGVVTAVKRENWKQDGKIVQAWAYAITTDNGGSVTKFGHYLQHAPAGDLAGT